MRNKRLSYKGQTSFSILSLLFLFMTDHVHCQQLPYFSACRENWVLLNPAFLNHFHLEDVSRSMLINFSRRDQMLGFKGRPQQSHARFENIISGKKNGASNMPKMKWGLGLENESLGSNSSSGLFANYAYMFKLNANTFISAGLTLSFSNHSNNLNPLSFKEEENAEVLESLNGIMQVGKADVGIFIKHKIKNRNSKIDHLYAGLSSLQISSIYFSHIDKMGTIKKPHFNLLAGAIIGDVGKGGIIGTYWEPTIWIRYLPKATFLLLNSQNINVPISIDFSIRYFLKGKIWLGGGIGTSGNINFETGYSIYNPNKKKDWSIPKIKTGILCNLPILGTNSGYSLEAFVGIGLASY
jgi:hypothetical protein